MDGVGGDFLPGENGMLGKGLTLSTPVAIPETPEQRV